jgi:hypothetical protein
MRAAYEAELNRITSGEMILQTTVSLLNIGGRRLGLGAPAGLESERDLEQVADAIDGARALMPILERRMTGGELGPLRDAIAQLQMAYAREVKEAAPSAAQAPPVEKSTPADQTTPPAAPAGSPQDEKRQTPGPAQASGRLWVPGR